MYVLGAGLSGLIAATQFPNAVVFEAAGESSISHRAVLRFRTDALSRLTGIQFKPVTVRKSIWSNGAHCRAAIDLSNLYSYKTNGKILDRSIWNLDPVTRFIAPEDLQIQMAEMVGKRIKFDHAVSAEELREMPRPIISTLPMPVLMGMLGTSAADVEFSAKGIKVDRYRVHGADVYQTIYFPDLRMATYRASITGDLLIIERQTNMFPDELREVVRAFGLGIADLEDVELNHAQRFGKITPIDDQRRKDFIFKTTYAHGIYSMGRFAVWKNILLDDVVNDGAIIKRLIKQGSYAASLHNSKEPS